jgi:hypothetical protein
MMSTNCIQKNLQNRIISTLKINPQMTYIDAVETVLLSMGILNSRGSLTPYVEDASYIIGVADD